MNALKERWKEYVKQAVKEAAEEKNIIINENISEIMMIEIPPSPDLGDIAFPMYPLAKYFRASPAVIADLIKQKLETKKEIHNSGEVLAADSYLNIKINLSVFATKVLEEVVARGVEYGRSDYYRNQKIMVEFSCPNTNKPLHLGHLRNDAIGISIANILAENGAEVKKVNLINDRGIHICKSMLAYKKYGNDTTPETEKIKSDHFVGNYYVKFNKWIKEDKSAEEQAREMLVMWEKGEKKVTELWSKMNKWAISGIKETYKKTGIEFDKVYYESETYSKGKTEVFKGLDSGIFYKEKDGSIWVDLSEIKLDKKVLLRSDETSLYLTQDIGTAVSRYQDWPFQRLIYVVGSEQQYHFKVLFHVLDKLGYKWAKNLFHLSYGMVNLIDGKMKSREGIVVDADDLLEELIQLSAEEIRKRERENEVDSVIKTSTKIALGALNYYLLKVSPSKDMIFNPLDSISFNGNTGPYLQYMGARISSMLRKYNENNAEYKDGIFKPELFTHVDERELIKLIAGYPDIVIQAGIELNPSLITGFLYNISKVFSRYYHDVPVLHNEDTDIVISRIYLCKAILQVFKNAFKLIGVPFLERM